MLPLFSIFYILGYTFLKKPCKYKKKNSEVIKSKT